MVDGKVTEIFVFHGKVLSSICHKSCVQAVNIHNMCNIVIKMQLVFSIPTETALVT